MFLQAKSAAAFLDLPVSTFYQLVREGRLPPAVSKVGRHRLWRRLDLVAYVDPTGYRIEYEVQREVAERRSQAYQAERESAVRLSEWPRHAIGGAANKAAGQSPFAGILGGSGGGSGAGSIRSRPHKPPR
jgi:excisionase family DNA binding protein